MQKLEALSDQDLYKLCEEIVDSGNALWEYLRISPSEYVNVCDLPHNMKWDEHGQVVLEPDTKGVG